MATNKRLTDLTDYTSVLPYDSELFGIYQPLIGWKSKRIKDRFDKGFQSNKRALLDRLKAQFTGLVAIRYDQDCQVHIELNPGALQAGALRSFDSILMDKIAEKLPTYQTLKSSDWSRVINGDSIEKIFAEFVVPAYSRFYSEHCRDQTPDRMFLIKGRSADAEHQRPLFINAFESQLHYESSLAGALLFLTEHRNFNELANLFYSVKDNAVAECVNDFETPGVRI
ncbi:hypothetical protein MELA_01923 [Candidatus Methylomirabilis lanthanidiphila]|uniref:Uncharacterized protein n=1 Tax=Candidatus Methylomirabilis lanthanidiphila TaxID=2211376 RepID=A0A564ZLU7_9BACT|nr:hypothetical protein [Candidatus Methylomirabilis lanthanidiphila]VUZ85538.1 hypothetical protein MELA_01923 [Candidatus Methylomirabilis lanthanidiphila]